uniref:Uncharacterized protein n=1 Tax=Podospora anserina (strain S / ATCC MYA-4624 / DSM 980 / FGSC 10383) TaxID=515849 RepID=A0A090CW44_PODAN|nr:Putative protein of unknown function [Podospora anserina S mat+]
MGHVPKPCYDTAVANSYCDPHDIDVWDVTYIDNIRLNFWKRCKVSKLFCQCISSPTTIEILATDFGKVPVKARQWIDTVSSYPGPKAAQPGTAEITLTSFRRLRRKVTLSVWFHEVAHSLDCWTTPRPAKLPETFCYRDALTTLMHGG